ncbi:alkaline phosphatase D family protein [Arundinibacter roseus]|uniref:Twin-arginine translocation pathway signal protein n=1 Tax=Arundinibacter roseus TaxID=2070510 RepID=A0A4R4KH96_9BACT|nr:alkaline phosphatase D family protein [Arundinibacter roseus]TDB67460.1 twin-arginine translocation pathway signal protein [Arundinibacter roseus]
MKRRTFLENSLLASAASLSILPAGAQPKKQDSASELPTSLTPYLSNWHTLPDRTWAGETLWANRLQDWQIRSGGLECNVRGKNRSVALLTHELGSQPGTFFIKTDFQFLNPKAPSDLIGLRLGSKGPIDDYRSAAIYGQGLTVGIRADGKWVVGKKTIDSPLNSAQLNEPLTLSMSGQPTTAGMNSLHLKVLKGAALIAETTVQDIDHQQLRGGVALLSHADIAEQQEFSPSARFENWTVEGTRIVADTERTYGPVYFAQYTLHSATVKLSALCAPVGNTAEDVALELRGTNGWHTVATSPVDPVSRIAAFRLTDWQATTPVVYRLKYTLRSSDNQPHVYEYEGSIAPAPPMDQPIKLGLFSCNCDHGFPDADLRKNILHHSIDAALFLGDQFYEASGGFGVEATTLDRSILDYMRKWQQFGWSYRDVFRHVPCISIPDDHDVYHGNVWGEGGKAADAEGTTYARQDSGGYKMHPDWVRMVQQTQTSHLPDPYDPTPIKQGISVYYTHWNWGPLSFAIVEDRKFKSAPKNIFPAVAGIQNGFITNLDFKDKTYLNAPQAELLGPRQEKFLQAWAADWKQGARMKILLSATNFCTLATLPENSTGDQIVPSLPIPKPGEYISGDAPTRDMDSNGWPHSKRNRAVDIIRRGFTLHLAGDQHLASIVHYGVDTHEDAGFAFAGPALNNIFPRRWWPKLPATHQPLPGRPAYTGNFEDGFGNKITVHAAASPRLTGLKPAIIHDRATGYGIVKIDPASRKITLECWKRSADPAQPTAESQYEGWPKTIHQRENYGRTPLAYLPSVEVKDFQDAVVQVINEVSHEIEYTLRIQGTSYRPPVFEKGKYTLRVGDPDRDLWKEFKGLRAGRKSSPLLVSLG